MSAPWMEIAWEQDGAGIAEIGGPQAHASIVAYFHDIGRPDITSDAVPWCAAAYFWCLMKAGVDISSIPAEDRLLAWSATKLGTVIDAPRVGCACVMRRRDKSSGRAIGHHVTFVTKWTRTTITGLGGNQADSFNEATFKRTADLIFVWPPPPASPAEVAAQGSRIAGAAREVQKDGAKATGVEIIDKILPQPPPDLPAPDTVLQGAGQFKGWVELGHSFLTFGWSKVWWIAAAIALYFVLRMAWNSGRIRFWRAQDAAIGKTLSAPAEAPDGEPSFADLPEGGAGEEEPAHA